MTISSDDKAFWISPEGAYSGFSCRRHIDYLIEDPSLFGFTREEILATYGIYDERLGVEGRAREVLIKKAVERGWVRGRLYPNRGWSLTVHTLNEAKRRVTKWAVTLLDVSPEHHYTPVQIKCLEDEIRLGGFDVSAAAEGLFGR